MFVICKNMWTDFKNKCTSFHLGKRKLQINSTPRIISPNVATDPMCTQQQTNTEDYSKPVFLTTFGSLQMAVCGFRVPCKPLHWGLLSEAFAHDVHGRQP